MTPTSRSSRPGLGRGRLRGAVLCLAAVAVAGCGDSSGASSPALRDGGVPAFERRVASLRGTPIVVNQWASWCGPCRSEFPHLRAQAEKRKGDVAFLGVDAMDSRDAAAKFLEKQPTGYEHFFDENAKIARSFGGGRVWPATAFYDARGEVVYLRQGTYATEQDLAEDIDRYALGG